jgi:hypothetical protein
MVAAQDGSDAVGHQRMKFDANALLHALTLAELTCFEYGFDGGEEAVGVGAHDGVELVPLGLISRTALKGVEVKADARDGSLEFVGDSVQEAILALVATDLADQEDSVEDNAGDEDRKKQEANQSHGEAATVVLDPRDVQDDGKYGEAHAKRDEERFGSAAACDVHKYRG